MPFRRLRVMARVAAGVLVFCVAATAVAARSEDALHAAVRKANGEWAAAMKTGDAAVIAAPYTDSAVFVLADGRSLQGRAAVERMYREGFQKGGTATSTTITSRAWCAMATWRTSPATRTSVWSGMASPSRVAVAT